MATFSQLPDEMLPGLEGANLEGQINLTAVAELRLVNENLVEDLRGDTFTDLVRSVEVSFGFAVEACFDNTAPPEIFLKLHTLIGKLAEFTLQYGDPH